MGGWRRIATVPATGLALAGAGCSGGSPDGADRPDPRLDTRTAVPWSDGGALDRVLRTRAVAAELARRRAELAELEGVATVRAALRRAFLSGAIAREGLERY